MALDLINTSVLLLALSLLQGFIVRVFLRYPTGEKLVSGLLFGSACLFAITIPVEVLPGASVDSRALILSLAGLFGGPVVALIATTMISFYLLGVGIGGLSDTAVLVVSAGWGLALRFCIGRGWMLPGVPGLMALGLIVHASAVVLVTYLPSTPLHADWSGLALPLILIFTPATTLLGLLLFDIGRRVKSETALLESQEMLARHLQNTPLAAIAWDSEFRCIQWNTAAERIFGFSSEEALGKRATDLIIPPELKQKIETQYRDLIREERGSQRVNDNITRDGRRIICEWYNTPIVNELGKTVGIASLGEDITAKKQTEELIWRQANYDELTGLANRKLLQDRLHQEMKKAERSGQSVALLYLDLDQFKDINDTLGHQVGDRLLQEAAHRLSSYIRDVDTVARLGGDEFTIVMGGLDDVNSVERVANAILGQMSQPFQLAHETAYISASIGITFFPQDGTDVADLFRNADQAMYAAKNMGRNCFHYFTASMQEQAQQRMSMVQDLHTALPNDEFVLHYQPIIDLDNDRVVKGEALIRWQHPERGLIMPDQFIKYAEETRMINDIGDWVYRTALQQALKWRQAYAPEFQICVNASPVQFDLTNLYVDQWVAELKAHNTPGQAVVIEITEGLLMENVDKFTSTLLMFRDAGIQVSLDDFGTGYSSLSYLKKLDIDYLKIDRSFVQNLGEDSDDIVLCHAIIAMAHKLGLKVVAEGIETQQQRSLLESAGCDYGQGFLFSKAVPVDEFEALLARLSKAS